mmetsp:Transcript_89642/g.159199  ORF Transcript_89642/g.159199 Transcript_89642/m.159199 type:complete len:886 (-) Transcript_89642:352-3009(-)
MVSSPPAVPAAASQENGEEKHAETTCVAIHGLAADATAREVHILFSACPGYKSSVLITNVTDAPYALVYFESSEQALMAAESRRGTAWEKDAREVAMVLGSPDILEEAHLDIHPPETLVQNTVQAKSEQAELGPVIHLPETLEQSSVQAESEQAELEQTKLKQAEKSSFTPPERKSTEKSDTAMPLQERQNRPKRAASASNHKNKLRANMARERLSEALRKKHIADLEAALTDAADAGLPEDALVKTAKKALEDQLHRINVRTATFQIARARQRLADAWDLLQQGMSIDPGRRLSVVDQALREGEEALSLCMKASQKKEEEKVKEALDLVSRVWLQVSQSRLQDAVARNDTGLMRAALVEGDAVKASLARYAGRGQEDLIDVPSIDDDLGFDDDSSAGAVISEDPFRAFPWNEPKPSPRGLVADLDDVDGMVAEYREEKWKFDMLNWQAFLAHGRRALGAEERRAQADVSLRQALDETSEHFSISSRSLRPVLKEAKEAGVDPAIIKGAEMAIAVYLGRAAARWCLMGAAVLSYDGTIHSTIVGPVRVKDAIVQAKSTGLGKRELQGILAFYDKIMRLKTMQETLAKALKTDDPPHFQKAIAKVEATGVTGEDSEMIMLYLQACKNKVKHLEEQEALAKKLTKTLNTGRKTILLQELPEEIKQARELGLADDAIGEVENALARAHAQEKLEQAIQTGEIEILREAIEECSAAGIDESLLEAGNTALAEEEMLLEINEASARGEVSNLKQMLKTWKERGFDQEVLLEAQTRLVQLQQESKEVQEGLDQILKQPVEFFYDDIKVTPAGREILRKIAKCIKDHPAVAISVDGYDMRKRGRFGLELSDGRAQSVVSELRNWGCINAMTHKGWGSTHPTMRKTTVQVSVA